jgi:hypothetical protein
MHGHGEGIGKGGCKKRERKLMGSWTGGTKRERRGQRDRKESARADGKKSKERKYMTTGWRKE